MAKKNKSVVLRESDIKKMKRDITHEVTQVAIFMFLAWLKDTERVDNDPDKLFDEYERLDSWCNAIDEHLISIKDIKRIIEEGIDRRIRLKESMPEAVSEEMEDGREGQADTGAEERES